MCQGIFSDKDFEVLGVISAHRTIGNSYKNSGRSVRISICISLSVESPDSGTPCPASGSNYSSVSSTTEKPPAGLGGLPYLTPQPLSHQQTKKTQPPCRLSSSSSAPLIQWAVPGLMGSLARTNSHHARHTRVNVHSLLSTL
jgi:hypothetical protein